MVRDQRADAPYEMLAIRAIRFFKLPLFYCSILQALTEQLPLCVKHLLLLTTTYMKICIRVLSDVCVKR